MSSARRRVARLRSALACVLVAAAPASGAARQVQSAALVNANAILLEGIRLYDAARYPDAVMEFGRVIDALNPAEAPQRDLLVKAYEYRARSRFVLRDNPGTEADFAQLLKLRPDYEPASDISPRVRAVFDEVKKKTVGALSVQLAPPGEITIDGAVYTAGSQPRTVPLAAGEHVVAARRRSYRDFQQSVIVLAGDTVPLSIALERTSATYAVRTIPDGVSVLFDGIPKGVTPKGQGEISGPLVIPDLAAGTYVTRYQRDCYRPLERSLTISELTDIEAEEPIRLEPSTARLTLRIAEPGATIYLDGVSKGSNPADVSTICEGEHLIEVRSPRGRFIDRRYWRTGDVETVNAVLRPAFAIVVNVPPAGVTAADFRKLVESGLAQARGALIFTPSDEELVAAQREEDLTPEFFHATSAAAVLRRREASERLAARLGVQGIAAIEGTGRPDSVQLSLLAAGSAEPELLTFDLNDAGSRANALAALTADIPPLVGLSIDAQLVDLAGTPGAAVVRAAESTGLTPGDVIVEAAGAAVTSVADLLAKLNGKQGQSVPLTVRLSSGATRAVPITPKLVPDTIPLADKRLLYNSILLHLQDALRAAKTPIEATAARLNLAIVQMRLGRWADAAGNLEQLRLPDGPGVSAGTVAYLLGLCYEALGRQTEAAASFSAAAKSTESMLSMRGPRTASLAQEKLQAADSRR